MAIIERDGIKLFYEDAGTGDPPLVFVHGWTCDHTYFAPQAEAFAGTHRVISVDLRGHGQSDKPEQEYSIAAFADDVAWLITELRLPRAVAIGHSMGGATVLQLAADHPELLAGIVMVDAAPIGPAMNETIAGLAEQMRGTDHDAVRRATIGGLLFGPHDDPVRKARIIDEMAAAPQHVAASCFAALAAWDGEAAARACAVPALHIGATAAINDAALFAGLNPAIHNAQTFGAGHFNQLEVPDQVNAMIARFLAVGLTG
jgi:pimeloyl-ACP methyl ester carboxylesterase